MLMASALIEPDEEDEDEEDEEDDADGASGDPQANRPKTNAPAKSFFWMSRFMRMSLSAYGAVTV